jgi:hypothetical protein
LLRHRAAAFNGSYVESVRSSAFGEERSLLKWPCGRSTSEFTGLRGLSRMSGGMIGWATLLGWSLLCDIGNLFTAHSWPHAFKNKRVTRGFDLS